MLPNACFEFEGSHQQGKKRLPVNPSRVLKGLQPHEFLPVIIRVNTYILMHPQEFWINIHIGGSGNALDRLYAEAEKLIGKRSAPISFTVRQLQVIRYTRQGYTIKEMALLMNIQEVTVKKHLKLIYNKLNAAYDKPNKKSSILWYADMAGIG